MRIKHVAVGAVLVLLAGLGLSRGAGVEQSDEWAWLEEVHGEKPLAWVREHNAVALRQLKADPDYQAYYDRVLAMLDAKDRIPYVSLKRGKAYNFWQDAGHPKGVWRVTSAAEYHTADPQWQVLLDLDALAASEKENWVWHGASTNSDQTRALVFLSRGGGDAQVTREYDLVNKRFLDDGFQLAEAKGGAAYLNDNMLLFETDFGAGTMTASGYPRIVKALRRGEPLSAAKTIFEAQVSDIGASGAVSHRPDGDVAFIVRNTTFFESEYYLIHRDLSVAKLPLPLSATLSDFLKDQVLFMLRKDWQHDGHTYSKGSLLAFSLSHFEKTGALGALAALYVPGPRASIESVSASADAVYVSLFENVRGAVLKFAFDGKQWSHSPVPLPAGGSPAAAAIDLWGSEVQFSYTDYLTPPTLYTSHNGEALKAIKSLPPRFDATGLVSEQFEATSKDGTKIPYTIVHAKDAKGPRPTILYGYGGFEISLTPGYSGGVGALWLTKGGNYVVANIRGGGEFGPAWHEAALKENRQRAFDDFAAVAADLETRGFTTPKQLGIMGGSNGGLLVSTVMVQHPELLGAVVCQVPLIDMLAYTRIGAGASWAAEYGDPAEPAARAYISRYSPYQNVMPGTNYAPVFFVTATSDDRVTPVHARKMAARMLAQGHDVLFFENTDGGHSAAANHAQAAEMNALTYIYFKQHLFH